MIAHMSVPAENPRETARFFAAVIDGLVFDFPVVTGAAIAVARDGSGIAVEVYPPSMRHHPRRGTARAPRRRPQARRQHRGRTKSLRSRVNGVRRASIWPSKLYCLKLRSSPGRQPLAGARWHVNVPGCLAWSRCG